VIEIKSSATITIKRQRYLSNWDPRKLQSKPSAKVVNERWLVADFEALRVYKSDSPVTHLQAPTDPEDCGIPLKTGIRYLVYAYGPDEDNRYSTNMCTRTAAAEESTEELEILSSLSKPVSVVFQPSRSEKRFNEALELIHLTIDEPDPDAVARATEISGELAQSDAFSGYSQTLQAEWLSTWQLSDDGKPIELQQEILALTDEALRINPKLAQAHVPRARTYMRAFRLMDASAEIQAALRLAPQLAGAIFVQAEIYRRLGDWSNAGDWMNDFMAATQSPVQKANGMQWLGDMSRELAYHPEATTREMNLIMGRTYYQSATQLDPGNARRLVTVAAFLNEYVADFAAAESYAAKSLAVEESELARYHLAAARYQALQAKNSETDAESLRASIAEIGASTGVSLDEAVEFWGFHDVTTVRLVRLQRRAAASAR
jgi:hypothetical protein